MSLFVISIGICLADSNGHIRAHTGTGGTRGTGNLPLLLDLCQGIPLFAVFSPNGYQFQGAGDNAQAASLAEIFIDNDFFHRQDSLLIARLVQIEPRCSILKDHP
jgi:hypothetical protein